MKTYYYFQINGTTFGTTKSKFLEEVKKLTPMEIDERVSVTVSHCNVVRYNCALETQYTLILTK